MILNARLLEKQLKLKLYKGKASSINKNYQLNTIITHALHVVSVQSVSSMDRTHQLVEEGMGVV